MYRRNENWYDVMQVCQKGHIITDMLQSNPDYGQKNCKQCGTSTISKCLKCKVDIRGYHHLSGVIHSGDSEPPEFCHECGKPYPWQGKIKKKEASEFNENVLLENIFKKIHQIVKQLRRRHNDRNTLDVKDEYDLQDLLHALLQIHFEDIRPEEYTPSYGGNTSKMDFLLPDEKLVIETKMTRNSLKNKRITQELIEDKEYYKKSKDVETLYCLIYDPEGYISNPRGLEKDIGEEHQDFTCKVYVVP